VLSSIIIVAIHSSKLNVRAAGKILIQFKIFIIFFSIKVVECIENLSKQK